MTRLIHPTMLYLLLASTLSFCSDLPIPPRPDTPASSLLLVTTSDFSSGFLSAISLVGEKVYQDIYPAHSDSTVRLINGKVAILNGLGMDNLTMLDPQAGYMPQYEVSLGRTSNPRDIAAVDSETAAIVMYNRAELVFVDTKTGHRKGGVSLAAYADADGLPEASAVYFHNTNNTLYLTLQRLNRNGGGIWPPTGQSYILKIDPVSQVILDAYQLPFTNPISQIRYQSSRDSLIFAAPGKYGANYALDGGVIEFNIGSNSFAASPLTEMGAGYEILDAIVMDNLLGFALLQDAQFITRFAAFDPQSHSIIKTMAISSSSDGFFTGILLGPNNKVYLADRSATKPGIRIFDTLSLEEETPQPINTGLPPYSMEILP